MEAHISNAVPLYDSIYDSIYDSSPVRARGMRAVRAERGRRTVTDSEGANFASLIEQTVARKSIYDGRMIRVQEWQVRLPNGREATREIVLHPGAVAILAEPQPDVVLLVRQFRAATGEVLLEVPAGKLDSGETPEHCAARELAEETGYHSKSARKLFEFFTSPGFADERIHLFHATDLTPGSMKLDGDEFIDVQSYSRREVAGLLEQGLIRDAKTLVALLWWQTTACLERT